MTTKVLAVDDSRTMRDMLKTALVKAGYTVDLAVDGAHGLEVLCDFRPDVIITDINMPRLDGFGFIEKVREVGNCRSTPILVLTTENAAQSKERARAAGATGWIVKPFDESRLVSVIQKVTT